MVGRKKEIEELKDAYDSGEAEFVVLYGRLGLGKTSLVKETFAERITFSHEPLSPISLPGRGSMRAQLANFRTSIRSWFGEKKRPISWDEAFLILEKHLMERDDGSRQLVFIDELPWMDTPRSGFVSALEGFWNNWACHRKNFMLIVCGSATSWILDRLINNHGGLYNRVTHQIRLRPFSLAECEEFFVEKGVDLSRFDIAQAYMAFGGIPYYLNCFRRGLSLAQNIDDIFFAQDAKLYGEFDRLFSSIIDNADEAEKIVRFLATRSAGYTREAITHETGISNGGTMSKVLTALVAGDFVVSYVPFGYSKREIHYRLVDPFCLFHVRFDGERDAMNPDFWLSNIDSPKIIAWRGLAFENLCLNHIKEIKKALGIGSINSTQSAWTKRGEGEEDGTQIDMLISRRDNIVNMCEMNFCNDEFVVDKAYDRTLVRRAAMLKELIPRRMTIHSTLITTYGLKYNAYFGAFVAVVTLDDLFA